MKLSSLLLHCLFPSPFLKRCRLRRSIGQFQTKMRLLSLLILTSSTFATPHREDNGGWRLPNSASFFSNYGPSPSPSITTQDEDYLPQSSQISSPTIRIGSSLGASVGNSATATQGTAISRGGVTSPTGSSGQEGTYTGDITHYNVGQGSCGQTNSDNDPVCALSVEMMANGPNPNTNPKCGTFITLTNPSSGGSWPAQIVDTCQNCSYTDVDLSPVLFSTIAPNGDGRVHGIQWRFS